MSKKITIKDSDINSNVDDYIEFTKTINGISVVLCSYGTKEYSTISIQDAIKLHKFIGQYINVVK